MSMDAFVDQNAWCEGWRKTPLWLRLLGAPKQQYRDGGRRQTHRMCWGELTLGWSGIALRIGAYETAHLNIALLVFQVFIRLPFLDHWMLSRERAGDCPQFGFSCRDHTLHLGWGRRTKVVWLPWSYHRIAHEFLAADGNWLSDDQKAVSWREGGVHAYRETHPYHYMLDNGEVQHVDATVTRYRSKAGWEWFGRGPISRALRAVQGRFAPWKHGLDIAFSGEVGSRAGSWKGGCVGCSYEMKPGETPRHTLARMQQERRFR